MTSEVIIDVQPKDISIALLEDKRLVEFQQEGRAEHFSVGNIYFAKVHKLMPGLNACFVNVGYERDAFLHYLDLGNQFHALEKYLELLGDGKRNVSLSKCLGQPVLEKDGSIQNTLKQGQEILVQIAKEPISTKGPRVTSEISFAGRFLVLIPFSEKISVSTKIKSGAERNRLKQLIQSIKPKGMGVIIRTVAEGKKVAELDMEMKILTKRWEEAVSRIVRYRQASRQAEQEASGKAKAKTKGSAAKTPQGNDYTKLPQLCYEETSRTVAMLRDLFNPSYENIYINDEAVFNEVKDYVGLIAPERQEIVKLYKGNVPIFDNFSITKQIKTSFGRTVTYKRGAYMIIEHTEALHVVDINSGNRSKSPEGQEVNALDVNLDAADELARQLRLRDMGGIIVVDFIDMNLAENRQKLYERMVENMKRDRARHNILPLSKFGLMQITRQRVRPAMDVTVEETCPTCGGTGQIKSSLLFTDVLETKIDTLVNHLGIHKFRLYVHPFVAAYINQGLISLLRKWQMKYGWGVRVLPSQKLPYLGYKFVDVSGQEIDMTDHKEMK